MSIKRNGDILEHVDDHRVTQQLLHINSWNSTVTEWSAHARSVTSEFYDIFLSAKVKNPNLLDN